MSARKSIGRWIAARKAVQITALLLVIALLIMTRRGGWPPEIVNLIMRLDPLAVLAQALSSRSFLLGSAVVLLTVLLTIVAGRAWCGWLCPLGTVLDLLPLRRRMPKDLNPGAQDDQRHQGACQRIYPGISQQAQADAHHCRRGGKDVITMVVSQRRNDRVGSLTPNPAGEYH